MGHTCVPGAEAGPQSSLQEGTGQQAEAEEVKDLCRLRDPESGKKPASDLVPHCSPLSRGD